jgi:protoporphyrin/coproporphyrin ferrochelatase
MDNNPAKPFLMNWLAGFRNGASPGGRRGFSLPGSSVLCENEIVPRYDALLIVSFGGPEKREEVIPFLENVLRGRNVPRERMLEVAEHYFHFKGCSPINDQNRALIAALRERVSLPIYWGNRNWHPLLADAVRQMQDDGVKRALAFVTSAFGSYSGCRQYIENIETARAEVGGAAPAIEKVRPFSDHPKFLEAMTDRVRDACGELPEAHLVFTAHSVPLAMARSSSYVAELERACAAVARALGRGDWKLAWQSRSGPASQPWLEPDISDYLREISKARRDVVIAPMGFLSDHMEVIYDLDVVARQSAGELGMRMARARTVGTHPAIVEMIAEMLERDHAPCDSGCCAYGARHPLMAQNTQSSAPVRDDGVG